MIIHFYRLEKCITAFRPSNISNVNMHSLYCHACTQKTIVASLLSNEFSFFSHTLMLMVSFNRCSDCVQNKIVINKVISKQSYVIVISRLDYCNALLAGLPSNTIKPLQMIQNAAARLVFNEPKRAHVTPLFVSLHWLPVAARIQFKTLMLA